MYANESTFLKELNSSEYRIDAVKDCDWSRVAGEGREGGGVLWDGGAVADCLLLMTTSENHSCINR